MTPQLKINTLNDFLNTPTSVLKRKFLPFYSHTEKKEYKKYLPRTENEYKQIVKGLRYFVTDFDNLDLRKKLHSRTKGKINKILSEYLTMSSGFNKKEIQVKKYKKKNQKSIRKSTGKGSNWKKVYVSTSLPNTEIKIKNNNIIEKNKYSKSVILKFNETNLMINIEKEIKRLFKKAKNLIGKFDNVYIITGGYFLGGEFSPQVINNEKSIIPRIERLIYGYENTEEWLFGLKFMKFLNPENKSVGTLREEHTKNLDKQYKLKRKKLKKKNAKLRRS